MTLRKLAERLNKLVAENDRQGLADRNDKDVCVRVRREGRRKDHYYRVRSAWGGLATVARAARLKDKQDEGEPLVSAVELIVDDSDVLVSR